jgi:hypothetical protein
MEYYGLIKISTMNMCDSTQTCGCPLPELENPPPALVASDYIRLKKDRLLYCQYKSVNPTIEVCNKTESLLQPRYKSYQLKQSIERGCFYDQVYCQCLCPKLTCKD